LQLLVSQGNDIKLALSIITTIVASAMNYLREKKHFFILYYDTSTRVLCRVAMLNDEVELQTMKLSNMICA